jgi:hypothetical protein
VVVVKVFVQHWAHTVFLLESRYRSFLLGSRGHHNVFV